MNTSFTARIMGNPRLTLEQKKRILAAARKKGIRVPRRNIIAYQQTHQGGEIKSVDIIAPNGGNVQTAFTLNSTAQFTALNLLTAGSSAWNRIGRKISLKSFRLQGFFSALGTFNFQGLQFCRIMLVYDKQPNGNLPAVADVLRDQINNAADTNSTLVTSGINLNNRDRFEIIAEVKYSLPINDNVLNGTDALTFTEELKSVDMYRKLGGRETHYKADSSPGVIGDVATGSLFLLTFGNLAAGTEAWALTASIRIRYSDL